VTVEEVVLHLGMGKTGSSALQVAFVRNRARLAELGIDYPAHGSDRRALLGETVSGNGIALTRYLCPEPATTAEQEASALNGLLEAIATSTATTLLYSSEILFYFQPDRLRSLHATLAEQGIRLRTLTYVRDVAGHALSSYAQMVKRSRYTEPLGTYLEGYSLWPEDMSMRPRLEVLVDTMGRDNTLVGHYDEIRKSIVQSFMRQVFGYEDLTGFDLAVEEVNRSLTAQEMEWMRYLSARLDTPPGSRVASDLIIKRDPVDPRGLMMTAAELQLLERRFGAEVEWVNTNFLGDGVLTVDGGATIVESRADQPPPTAGELFLLDCFAEVVNDTTKPTPPGRGRKASSQGGVAEHPRKVSAPATMTAKLRRRLGAARRRLRPGASGPGVQT